MCPRRLPPHRRRLANAKNNNSADRRSRHSPIGQFPAQSAAGPPISPHLCRPLAIAAAQRGLPAIGAASEEKHEQKRIVAKMNEWPGTSPGAPILGIGLAHRCSVFGA